jgi:hypothetical protein
MFRKYNTYQQTKDLPDYAVNPEGRNGKFNLVSS